MKTVHDMVDAAKAEIHEVSVGEAEAAEEHPHHRSSRPLPHHGTDGMGNMRTIHAYIETLQNGTKHIPNVFQKI